MTSKYFREAHQVGHRRVVPREGRGRPVHYGAVDLQPGTAVDNSTPRAGRERVGRLNQRGDIVEIHGAPGYKPKSQSGSASCAPWLVSRPSGAANDAGDLSAIVDRPGGQDLRHGHPARPGMSFLPGVRDHAGRRVGAHALGCVESCARGLVAGGGEPAGVQILPIRVRLEAMQVRCCGT